MTRTTNARLAGFAFLLYIAVGISSLVLSGRATGGGAMAAQLASVAQHTTMMRLTVLLNLVAAFCALVLGVTLYGLTRDEDRELAALGLACRAGEGVIGIFSVTTLGLLWLATATGPSAPDAATAHALGSFLQTLGTWQGTTAAILFAIGSALFSWLFLRGRMIPAPLAGLGVVASVLLVVGLPPQLAGFFGGPIFWFLWLPMLVFELALAFWLIVKGAAPPRPTHAR